MISSAASAASKEQRWQTIIEKDDHRGRALLEKNAEGWIPMIYYSRTGNVTMVRYLIARGADGRKVDSDGWFPLLWAAAEGYLEIVNPLMFSP